LLDHAAGFAYGVLELGSAVAATAGRLGLPRLRRARLLACTGLRASLPRLCRGRQIAPGRMCPGGTLARHAALLTLDCAALAHALRAALNCAALTRAALGGTAGALLRRLFAPAPAPPRPPSRGCQRGLSRTGPASCQRLFDARADMRFGDERAGH